MATPTQKALNGLEFALTKFPTSISGIRFFDGATKLAMQYDIYQVAGFDLAKLGTTAALMGKVCYIPKFIASVDAVVVSIRQYDSAEKVKSVTNIFFASIKVVGDGAGSMKFFVAMGMTFYVGKGKLSYIKDVCSVISIGKFFFDVWQRKPGSGRRNDVLFWDLTARGLSTWLSGMRAFIQYVDKDAFGIAGKTQITYTMWHIIGMLASVASAVKDCKKG